MRICLDTETTGLDPAGGDEILQLSIVDSDTKQVIFDKYFKPEHKTEWVDAARVNQITPEMVKDCKPIREYYTDIQSIFDNAEEIIGYNTKFDLGFLEITAGIAPLKSVKIVDVMQEYAECYGEWDAKNNRYKWVKLVDAGNHFGFDWDQYQAHNSLSDVFATIHVYDAMRSPDPILIF